MNQPEISFSKLTTEQIEDLQALESKFRAATGQETILIAYENTD